MLRALSLLVLSVCVLAGCYSSGTDFDTKKVSTIEKGRTSEAQVIQLLGQPSQRTTTASGGTMLHWTFVETNSVKHLFDLSLANRSTTTSKVLMVTLDKGGIVQDYTLTEGATLNQSYH